MATTLDRKAFTQYAPLLLALTGLLAVPPDAVAQLAPNGEHYAGRPTDTGFGECC